MSDVMTLGYLAGQQTASQAMASADPIVGIGTAIAFCVFGAILIAALAKWSGK